MHDVDIDAILGWIRDHWQSHSQTDSSHPHHTNLHGRHNGPFTALEIDQHHWSDLVMGVPTMNPITALTPEEAIGVNSPPLNPADAQKMGKRIHLRE
jgi:hypothetical protein